MTRRAGAALVDGRAVRLVRDNVVGSDVKCAGAVFGVFRRLPARHGFEGTGIGLATLQRIVDRQGGAVWCHATPWAGATFRFTLQA